MLKRAILSFSLLLALASSLRISGITFDSLWLDESYQSLVDACGQELPDFTKANREPYCFHFAAPQPLSSLLHNFRKVDPLCPPLYAICLNRWLIVFGNSDLAIRSLSVVFSLACLAVVFWLTYSLFGLKPAIFASCLEAVSPFDIYYAQEARMYSLVALTSAASCGCLLLLLNWQLKTWQKVFLAAIYILSSWALINSHYTGLFVIAFQVIYAASLLIIRKDLKLALWISASWLCLSLLWLPWFTFFAQAAAVSSEAFYVTRQPTWWWPLWALLIKIPGNWLSFLAGKKVGAYAILLYATSAAMLTAAVFAIKKGLLGVSPANSALPPCQILKRPYANFSIPAGLLMWAFIPSVLLWTLDVLQNHRVVEITRYTIGAAPAIYILAGLGLYCLRKNPFVFKLVIICHLVFAFVNNAYAHLVPQREPWQQMATCVETLSTKDDLILVSQYYNIVCLDRYLSHPLRQLGVSPAMGQKHITYALAGIKRFVLVTAQEGEAIKELIPARFQLVKQVDLSHGLHLRIYCHKNDKQTPPNQ